VLNVSEAFLDFAQKNPKKVALITSKKNFFFKKNRFEYQKTTFEECEYLTNQYINGLNFHQTTARQTALVFIKPSVDFFAITFALFYKGITPIFIDPGMGIKTLMNCIEEIKPDILIAENKVHFIKLFFPKIFKSIKISIARGFWPRFLATPLKDFTKELGGIRSLTHFVPKKDDLSAILFTSGGTGKPKGVKYTHDIFIHQIQLLKEMFSLKSSMTDMSGFPLFSLFVISLGLTSVIPWMNPSKPSRANPKDLLDNIKKNNVNFISGSPAIWEGLALYCLKEKITLPTVQTLAMFGAPVQKRMHEMYKKILPNGVTATPYGATESLPVSSVTSNELTQTTTDLNLVGTNIGRPVSGVQVKIINITDDMIQNFSDIHELPTLQIGEIIVQSPCVTPGYINNSNATKLAKIYDGQTIWHRMGDLGYFDKSGRLWFCGRKTHRQVYKNKLLCSIPTESVLAKNAFVKKSALINYHNRPAFVVERVDQSTLSGAKRQEFFRELRELTKEHKLTADIDQFFISKKLPVDCRHNIKIDRLKLSRDANNNQLRS
jgi:olefin beta-lactone synthetase